MNYGTKLISSGVAEDALVWALLYSLDHPKVSMGVGEPVCTVFTTW